MRRLVPESAELSIGDAFGSLGLPAYGHPDRPYLMAVFVTTLDGHATIDGRAGPIGSRADTEVLLRSRTQGDAVMVGAGTLRVERYGRMVPNAALRAARELLGLSADPLAITVSSSLGLPWDTELFTCGHGEVVVITDNDGDPPPTETPVRMLRQPEGIDLPAALATLRAEGIRAITCEGGPQLFGDLVRDGLADELLLTIAPKLAGGIAPRILEGTIGDVCEAELVSLHSAQGDLFGRWRLGRA